MRILHIDAGREWRGGQRQALLLIEGLAARGHEQWLATPPDAPLAVRAAGLADGGVHLLPVYLRQAGGVPAARHLGRLMEEEAIDLCAVHDAHAHQVAALATLRRPQIPVAVHRRVDFALRGNPVSRWKYSRPNAFFIAISSGVREVLIAGGVASERIHVVHSCFDPRRWKGPFHPEQVRAELGIPDDAPIVGNVAALTDHKGHIFLIEAAPIVLSEIPDAHIVIVGEGEERPALQNRIAALNLKDRIHLVGYRENVGDYYAAFTCFVLSSHMEGLCTSLLDAMFMGVPIIATRTGGVPDIIREEETGLLVPPRDSSALAEATVRLLRDRVLCRSLVDRGRTFALEGFTPERMVDRTERLYLSFLRSRAVFDR